MTRSREDREPGRRVIVAAFGLVSALALTGCPRGGVGAECDEASDCQNGLVCSPTTNTCVDPGTGTVAAPGTDAANTDAANTDAAPGTDATTGTDAAMGTDSAPPATDAGPDTVDFCGPGSACPPGETCEVALCSRAGEGFCHEAGRPTCGGFAGLMCPPGVYSECLGQGFCVADAGGICVTPEEMMMICATQGGIWACP
jgi:hypothetical protein